MKYANRLKRLPRQAKKRVAMSLLKRHYGPENVNPKGARRVAFFPRLGIAYNRLKKNANTTTVILLRELESGAVESRTAAKSNALKVHRLPFRDLLALGRFHTFVVVRNPYSRVLSAFLQKFTFEPEEFRVHGNFEPTPEGFRQFVLWMEDGGLTRDAHWDLQTKYMMMPLDQYDTVIRFENYGEEMKHMLSELGLEVPTERLADLYPSDTGKKTSANEKLSQYYTPELQRMVKQMYSQDFEALKYSSTFPA